MVLSAISEVAEMTNHVVSRPLAEKLKEAGFPQKTIFMWDVTPNGVSLVKSSLETLRTYVNGENSAVFAAPLATELLEVYPYFPGFFPTIQKVGSKYRAGYKNDHGFWEFPKVLRERNWIESENPADALAEIYLLLKEQ